MLKILICCMTLLLFFPSCAVLQARGLAVNNARRPYTVKECGYDLQKIILMAVEQHSPRPYEISIKILADSEGEYIKVYAKGMPDAYLIGFNPLIGESPDKYITNETEEILKSRLFEEVANVRCPTVYNEKEIKKAGLELASAIWLQLAQDRDTTALKEFLKYFDKHYDLSFEKTFMPLDRKSFLRLASSLIVLDFCEDKNCATLKINLYLNAVVYDGGSSKLFAEEYIKNRNKQLEFLKIYSFEVKNNEVDTSVPKDEFSKMLNVKATYFANLALAVLKNYYLSALGEDGSI